MLTRQITPYKPFVLMGLARNFGSNYAWAVAFITSFPFHSNISVYLQNPSSGSGTHKKVEQKTLHYVGSERHLGRYPHTRKLQTCTQPYTREKKKRYVAEG